MRRRSVLAVMLVAVLVFGTAGAGATEQPVQPETAAAQPAFGDLSSPIRPGASFGGYCTYSWAFYDVV